MKASWIETVVLQFYQQEAKKKKPKNKNLTDDGSNMGNRKHHWM